ncbi:hypothetical protein NX862_06835 [Rhodobacter sp. KR11]|nr:hypothetical protein [Rhodobacter sp. KR11]MCW1918461.1 hypothetical protein [Rhodobacter sp. KR11]
MFFGAALAGLSLMMVGAVQAGPIDNACLRSDRDAANRQLCSCIQRVANQTLTGGDQRQVAAFFKNPDKAQSVRMSQSDRDDAFWDRYQAFSAAAAASCQG